MRSAVNGLATTQLTPAAFCSFDPTASPQPVITAIGIRVIDLPDLTRQFPTAHSGHANVGEHAIKLHFAEERQRLAATLREMNFTVFAFENLAEKIPNEVFVVDHQQSRRLTFVSGSLGTAGVVAAVTPEHPVRLP